MVKEMYVKAMNIATDTSTTPFQQRATTKHRYNMMWRRRKNRSIQFQ